MVADGELSYVLLTDGGGMRGGSSDITAWVQAHGAAVQDAGVTNGTLYRVSA
jgi:hypothetical protein